MTSAFLELYSARIAEYLLAVGYLVAFVAFWKYLQGGRKAPAAVRARAAPETAAAGWFGLPAGVFLHPGHTWARPAADGLVEVGIDDFAARLLGPVERLELPQPGAVVSQGAAALVAADGGKRVPLVSPVDGLVAEVAGGLEGRPWLHEPYGGWLFKVRPARLEANEAQLFAGALAQKWLDEAGASLAARLAPRAGQVLQDGGTPVAGIARELDPEGWDALCREYFRS